MNDGFVRENKILEKNEEETQVELIKAIIDTKKKLEIATKNFEYAEEELIDFYTFEIKAARAKLDYLVKKAKRKSMQLDMINELKIRLYEDKVV